MLAGSSQVNSTEHALGTRNPCHRQYTSNSHLFSYSSDHGCFAMVNSIVVVSVLNYAGLLTMMCPTLPILSYVYIVILTKSIFFPTISLYSGLCMSVVIALLEPVRMHLLKSIQTCFAL